MDCKICLFESLQDQMDGVTLNLMARTPSLPRDLIKKNLGLFLLRHSDIDL